MPLSAGGKLSRPAACAALLALAAACSRPSAASCSSDGDCAQGQTCSAGVCQTPLGVAITAPADGARVRAVVTVQGVVTGGAPATLSVLVDGNAVGSATPPYAYSLDTSGLTEGRHELKLRMVAGTQTYESPARAIHVDRTRPGLAGWEPVSPTSDLWVKDGVTVTFDEAVDAASVSASLQCTWGGTALACDVAPLAGGAAYRVSPRLGPVQLPDGDLGIALARPVADLAGNELVAGASWTGRVPTWQLPGGVGVATVSRRWDHTGPYAALDAQGRPVVAYTITDPGDPAGAQFIAVKRFDGSRWSDLGVPFRGEYQSSLDLDAAGEPVVAATDRPAAGGSALHVWRYSSGAFGQLGGSLLRGTAAASFPVVRVDPSGNPVVAWAEDFGAAGYVSRWTGTQWEALGGAVNAGQVATPGAYPAVALVLDSAGNPVVAWKESGPPVQAFVRRWDAQAGAWSAPLEPMTPSAGCDPHTLVLEAGRPHLVCTWSGTFATYRAVLRLDSWGPPTVAWSASDAMESSNPIGVIGLAVAAGGPVMAWWDASGGRFASQLASPDWHPAATLVLGNWRALGTDIIANQAAAGNAQQYGNFVRAPDGTMALAFETNDSFGYRVWVKRFNR